MGDIVKLEDGTEVEYHCLNSWVARWAAKSILAGETYPAFSELDDVSVILDIGANCGAASVFFARTYPHATIHAFEPAQEPFGFLERNADNHPGIRPVNIGLLDKDDSVPLFHGKASPGASSIHQTEFTTDEHEMIVLKAADRWLRDHDVDRIDVVKIDTEGCEVPILQDLADRLADIGVVYLEFHSEDDRRTIDELLAPTHELRSVRQAQTWTGELGFVNRSVLA